MINIGKGGKQSVKTILMSRYAGYLVIQNADPRKEIIAQGQTYFAIQTRRQELSDRIAFWKTTVACSYGTSSNSLTTSWPMPPGAPGSSNLSTMLFSRTTVTKASTMAWIRRLLPLPDPV
jgi:hypothetical protein